MDYVLRKENNFEYLEEGEGHTIILLHGLFGALSNFEDVINYFSKKFKIVVPLMPLYTMPILSTTVRHLGTYIEEFIDFKGYKNITLLGNSLGGHVALIYTLKKMENVHSIVLTGSSGLYENSFGGSYPRKEDYNYIKKKIEYTFYDPINATRELVDEVFEIVNNKGKLIRILSLAKSAIRHNMANELPKFKLPTCLIWGRNDNITPPDVAEEFNTLMPNANLYWIDKCGHAPMMERPQQFNEILNDWLVKHASL
ncbi:MAG: alpha/beta hydrolase [Bacteroidota bacterium]|nr:alpha/beta hydrolase [Bacteroidota bacterium]